MKPFIQYASLGLQIVITVGAFILIGRFLDNYFGCSKPWFTLLGGVLGSIATLINLIKKI